MPRAGGVRDVLHGVLGAHPALRVLNDIARTLAGAPARAVRAALFDKSSASNWLVAWHQDLSIAVRTREELAGFRNWSLKQGVWHVQPPWTVLENMLTLRLHLDDCGVDNGPLQVLPGSHQWGRLDEPRIAAFLMAGEPVTCSARAGDVLALRPGLLHASGKAKTPSRRRVLHVEYATQELPRPLCWRDPPPDPSG
jgi:ectoine hydroxylase-related dioxygenase (phytanoyl-CoA dioxygenase family)